LIIEAQVVAAIMNGQPESILDAAVSVASTLQNGEDRRIIYRHLKRKNIQRLQRLLEIWIGQRFSQNPELRPAMALAGLRACGQMMEKENEDR
jgi:hypothetical protein